MPTHLLLAPAASGKTHAQLQRVRAVLREAPLAPVWVILPNRNQAMAFRQRLAQAGGALGAQVGTLGDLYTEVLAQAATATPVAPEPVIHRLLRAAVDTLADRGQLHHYLPIQHYPGFIQALGDFIAELKRARLVPEHFVTAVRGRGPRLEELGTLYEAYQQQLIRLDWADPDGLSWLAVLALENQPHLLATIRLLVVDGFDSFTPTQLEALNLLAARVTEMRLTLSGEPAMPRAAHRRFKRTLEHLMTTLAPTLETLPRREAWPRPLDHLEAQLFEPHPARLAPGRHVTFLAAQTMAREAREAVRWIKARHLRDHVPLAECAIITRDLGPYQAFLRAAAREFGVPLQLTQGEPLASNPAIAALLTALALPLSAWLRRPLLDTLRTPYFDLTAFDLTPFAALQLDAVARWGQVTGGLAQWADALNRLAQQSASLIFNEDDATLQAPRPPQGSAAAQMWARLQKLSARLTPPATATLTEFVAWLEDLLTALQLEACIKTGPATAGRDQTALIRLTEILQALVLSESILPHPRPEPYADFYSELRGAVEAATYHPELTARASLLAAPLSAARGVPYRAVVVVGLAEGLFPVPLTEDPFLSDADRASLQTLGLPLEPRLRSDQQSLFYEAVTRATEFLLLTRPYLADDGEEWKPSPYWEAALSLFDTTVQIIRPDTDRPLADAASLTELLALSNPAADLPSTYAYLQSDWENLRQARRVLRARLAPQPEGIYEGLVPDLGPALAARYGPDHIWSASRLETYGACGFNFFIGAALELEPRETPQAGLDSAQRGAVLHAILERVYQVASDPTKVAAVLAVLPPVAEQVFATAPAHYGFRPTPLWDQERAELLETLGATLTALAAEESGWRPAHFELRFGWDGSQPLTVHTPTGVMQLHGVIDRIDLDEAGAARVLDYKTGASSFAQRDLVEGRRLQIGVYALAAKQLLHPRRLDDGFYWGINAAKASGLHLAKFDHENYSGVSGALTLTTEHLARHRAGIHTGRFAPIPPRGGCPPYCPARYICWRYSPATY